MPSRATAARRPVASFVALAFAFSWACWSVSALGHRGGVATALFVLGGFGPLVAALVMVRLTGHSAKRWFKGLFLWRVDPRWYLFAVGVPIGLAVLVTAEFAVAGNELDWSLLDTRLAAFLPTLVLAALLQGGNEEPGWRGFALGRMQDRFAPVRATLLLGGIWALWHLPLLIATDEASHGLATGGVLVLVALTMLSIVGYAFAYTYLLNKTGSVLLCILLHAGFNTAMSSAGLRAEDALQGWDYVLALGLGVLTIWFGVALLIKLTGGRLGHHEPTTPLPLTTPLRDIDAPSREPALATL
jgi:uncharacterized protein